MAASPTVHLIDDDDAVRDSLVLLFEAEGLPVRPYASVDAFLQEERVRGCVVSDVTKPGLGGLELVRTLQARGVTTPVVLITGRSHRGLAEAAAGLGVYRLMEKPFPPDEIVGVVRAAMDGAAG